MNRRLSAWLALLSMLAGIVLPAHVHARAFVADLRGGDFCVAGQGAKSLPSLPEGGHAAACDMCSGCAGGAAAPPRASLVTPHPSPAGAAPGEPANILRAADVHAAAYPRGPPRALTLQ
jgi:hypothetical protein